MAACVLSIYHENTEEREQIYAGLNVSLICHCVAALRTLLPASWLSAQYECSDSDGGMVQSSAFVSPN